MVESERKSVTRSKLGAWPKVSPSSNEERIQTQLRVQVLGSFLFQANTIPHSWDTEVTQQAMTTTQHTYTPEHTRIEADER